MATYVPAKRGVEFIFYIFLRSQADSTIFQSNPTIAAGDFKISKDGGALANPSTLPAVTPGSSKAVKVTLSATEMEADNLVLIASDAAGAEWMDGAWNIQTSARQVDDLAFPNTSGRGMDVDASGGVEVGSFQANAITTAAINDGAITAAKLADGAITAAKVATGAIDADAIAADAVTEIQSGLATAADLATVAGYVDTEVAAIKTETDKIAAIKAKTDSLTFTVANQLDANIQSVNDVTVNGAGTASNPWGP